MNWYKKAQIQNKGKFDKGAIFGYTRTYDLRSKSVFLKPEIAKTWGQTDGISHEKVFSLYNSNIDAFTWIYDISKKRLDGAGLEAIPNKVRSAILAEVYAKI